MYVLTYFAAGLLFALCRAALILLLARAAPEQRDSLLANGGCLAFFSVVLLWPLEFVVLTYGLTSGIVRGVSAYRTKRRLGIQ